MKKLLLGIMLVLLSFSAMGAGVGDTLGPQSVAMGTDDVKVVEYCVFGVVPEDAEVDINVDPICKEGGSDQTGCEAGDDFTHPGFNAVSASPSINLVGGAGCVDIILTTDATASGKYYYTVNSDIGSAEVASETGDVTVPEFTVIGGLAALAIAGVYVKRKRD